MQTQGEGRNGPCPSPRDARVSYQLPRLGSLPDCWTSSLSLSSPSPSLSLPPSLSSSSSSTRPASTRAFSAMRLRISCARLAVIPRARTRRGRGRWSRKRRRSPPTPSASHPGMMIDTGNPTRHRSLLCRTVLRTATGVYKYPRSPLV